MRSDNAPLFRRSASFAAELDTIAARLTELKTLEPTPALEREADAIEARLAEITLAAV